MSPWGLFVGREKRKRHRIFPLDCNVLDEDKLFGLEVDIVWEPIG